MNLAFYGKGGIGKSTVASNISAALALSGKRVLHIGCDPKADSTRPLTQKKIPTVLNQLNTLAEDVRREDLVFPGKCGVSCIEAGGPQAGLGCAGMGITTMEETLRRLGILEEEWDTVVYDVLGDVVCGGFSVPMRKGFADRVFVVTSADYMSLYAANNILKAIRRFSKAESSLMGGLILNHCQSETDQGILRRFAALTGTQVVLSLPQCREIPVADCRRQLVVETFPDCEAAKALRRFADRLEQTAPAPLPAPLDEEDMERFGQWASEVREAAL